MPKEKEARSNGPAAATVVVTVPENAKLTIDGRATTSSSTSRRFVSPPLQRGYQYFYTIKGEVTRDGKTLTTSKRVLVTAGQETKVSLDFNEAPTTNVASR